ncbi:glycosyltransferase family 69 protein [Amylocarpus encephaloides]|uniref:Glycosyltransferase family 69 protein n=1 Tax=Amylocarpus encephaloides TaxID=45428 RepID=A0A9P7YIX9_9HELO|nr:glycosyltransferase family 69 protein [Amylocarpus encephaloides]
MLIPRTLRRSRRLRPVIYALPIFLLWDTLSLLTTQPVPQRTDVLSPSLVGRKIYLASIARNSEYMLRLYWNTALISLCTFLGPENVYVSIVESGSQDDTKGALVDLQVELGSLGVKNRIVLGEDMEEQMRGLEEVPGEGEREGWVRSGRGESGWEKRRIPHLAALRNRAMEPLFESEVGMWDRVLWINDVIFTNEDVATLLSTRDGEYAAACALDFSHHAEIYYDTFALRDSAGHETLTRTYPFFYSSASLSALLHLKPIPVQSCWNGIVAFDAAPFYASSPRGEKSQANDGLRFRGIADSLAQHHLEASECCLIHADNPLRKTKGVWMNPNVRVTFNESTYPLVNPATDTPATVTQREDIMANTARRMEGREGAAVRRGHWPGRGRVLWGVWGRRAGWLGGWVRMYVLEGRVNKRVDRWAREGRWEGGKECVVEEMQVLFANGWKHR